MLIDSSGCKDGGHPVGAGVVVVVVVYVVAMSMVDDPKTTNPYSIRIT
jgi:hypothetical protein